MSLIAHYKLDGLAASIGQDLTYFNNSGKLVPADGKFGTAYQRMGLNDGADYFGTTEDIHLSSSFTMSCWAYVTSAEPSANGLVTNHDHSTNTGAGITVKYISPTDFRISCNTGTGTSRTYDSYYGTSNIKDRWSHLLLRFDASTNNLSLWVNGVEEFSMTYVMKCLPDKLQLFKWSTSYDVVAYRPGAIIDDVRIYDHALSEREVRDLSQGLVLHYTFDQFQEPTENVFTNPIFSGTTGWSSTQGSIIPIGDGVLSLRRSVSGASEFQLYQVIPFSVGQVTTISFKCKKVEGTGAGTNSFGFDIGVWGMTPTWNMTRVSTEDIGNGWYKLTYVLPAATNSSGGATTGIHSMTNNLVDTYHIKEIQYERKSYATPFVNGTRAGIVRDQSTQGNDAPLVLANTPKWVEGGMVGKGCYELNQTKYITLPKSTLGSLTNCTFSFWRKRTSAGSWIVGNSGTPTGSSYFMATSGGTGAFYHSGVGTPVIYRDGVLSTTPANDDLWHHYCLVGANLSTWVNLHINAYDMGTTWLFRGQIDDIRIYTTALTPEEIKEIYQQRASLDSGGNLLC